MRIPFIVRTLGRIVLLASVASSMMSYLHAQAPAKPLPQLPQAVLQKIEAAIPPAATDSFYDWPEAAALLGGLLDGHPWGAGGTWAFKLDEPEHSLNRVFGGKGFKLQDEIDQFKAPYTRADRRVLASLDLSDPATGGIKNGVKRTDGDFAVAWIKTHGQGRVFYCSLGHAANVFQAPDVLRFYLDGIQYAAGDLTADASPR